MILFYIKKIFNVHFQNKDNTIDNTTIEKTKTEDEDGEEVSIHPT